MFFSLILSGIILIVAVALLYFYLTWNYGYWKRRQILGPEPKILFGTFKKTLKSECNIVDELNEIYSKFKRDANFVGLFMTRNPQIFILDPQLANEVLVTKFTNFHDNESSKWTSANVEQLRVCSPFVSTGNSWREKRSELVPALTNAKLKAFYPVVKDVCSRFSTNMHNRNLKGVNADDLSTKFTAELVSDFIWGIKADAFNLECTIKNIATKMVKQAFNCVTFYLLAGVFPILRRLFTVRFFPKISDKFFLDLLNDAIALRLKHPTDRSDLLSHLLQLQEKKGLTNVQMAGHTTTMVIDGFATGAIVIAHCLLMLGRNKQAQDTLRQEIFTNLEEDGFLSFENLNDLPYLEQCVQETLRIFPPLAVLSKICTESVELTKMNGDKLRIEPGTIIQISMYSFHHDADYFPNPEEFIPERFNEENGGIKKYRDNGTLLPFGDGPRMCLGMKFGLLEMKAAVVEILKNFEISVSKKTRMDNRVSAESFLLSIDGGIYLDFKSLLK